MLKRTKVVSKRERDEELLTTGKVAAILKVSTQTVRRLVQDGILPGVVVGKRMIRVRRADLNSVMRRL